MDTDEIKRKCEARFQSGGGKVQTRSADGWLMADNGNVSRLVALRRAFPGQSVWARRRNRTSKRFEWVLVGVGS